jgi:anti-sigma B factor antagonist
MPNLPGNIALVSPPEVRGDAVVAAVRGEIDLHNSPELRIALLGILAKSSPKKLILNLGQVPYMDSSAVAVLVEALQKLRRFGGKLMLTDLQPRVKGLLEIARLDSIFVLAVSEAEALSK